MNKKIKKGAIVIVTVQFLICLFEIVSTIFHTIPKYAVQKDTSEMLFNHYLHISLNIFKILIFYVIIFLMDYKEQHEFEEDMTSRSSFFSKYNTLIIIYLYFITMIIPFFSIIAMLIVPLLMYKVLDLFYKKFKYYKIFLYAALEGLVRMVASILFLNNVKVKKLNPLVLPDEIIRYFFLRKFKVNVLQLDIPKLNVGVAAIFDVVTIVVFGKTLEIMSTEELISILYHEIGHIENKSILYRMLVNKSISVILYITEFVSIYYNRKLISPVERQSHNYIKMYVLMNITVTPILTSLNMYFSCLDELESDKFSVYKFDRKYLISALIRLTFENQRYYGNTRLYDLMYFDHPSLDRRIKYIENIK